jgi:hypothetical protein
MDAKQSKFVIRLLPSLADFAFLMPIFFLFGRMDGAKTLLGDGDAGWHIRTGQWILANHRVPVSDLFSFSKPGQIWYAWEWLAEVVWAWLVAHGGLATLVLFCALLISATYTMLYRLARRKANPLAALAVTMIAAAASSVHWLARPHLFTLLFVVLFYIALERERDGRRQVFGAPFLLLLPALTVVWTNLHGGFVAGIAMIGAYAAGELLRMAFAAAAPERRAAWCAARRYLLASLFCLAASLVNPYTYHLHVHVFQYLRDPFQSEYINEFLTLSFHHPSAIFFEVLLLGAAATTAWNLSRRSFIEPVLIVLWAHGAQHSPLRHRGRASRGGCFGALDRISGPVEYRRLAPRGVPQVPSRRRRPGRHGFHLALAPGQRAGCPGRGRAAVRAPSAREVPR